MAKQQVKKQSILDIVVNATKRMAKDKKVDINFYDEKYAPYFADFVRRTSGKRNLTDKECLDKLNDDFLRNVNGGLLKDFHRERNISQAYTIYKNVVATAETKLAKEYGEDNYYELEKSKNTFARLAFKEFEEWQKVKDKQFQELAKVSEAVYAMQHSKNPMKELSQNGLVITPDMVQTLLFVVPLITGGIGGGVFGFAVSRSGAFSLICVPLGLLVGAMAGLIIYAIFEEKTPQENMDELLNSLAKEYGFSSGVELVDAINKSTYSYLTEEEAQSMHNYLLEISRDSVAVKNGFENFDDAMNAIDNAKVEEFLYQDTALDNLASERQIALESLAQRNALTNYDDMIKYLENHKILVGETSHVGLGGAGWSEYSYDTPTARAIANQLDYVDHYYTSKIEGINSQIWPQKIEVINDEALNDLALKLNAQEVVVNASYENLITDDANVFYSPSLVTQNMGTEVIDIANQFGEDTVTTHTDQGNIVIGSKASELNIDNVDTQNLSDSVIDNVDNAMQAVEISPVDMLAGAGVGAGLTVVLKNGKAIKDAVKTHKANKKAKQMKEIEEQIEKDIER